MKSTNDLEPKEENPRFSIEGEKLSAFMVYCILFFFAMSANKVTFSLDSLTHVHFFFRNLQLTYVVVHQHVKESKYLLN